MYSVIERGVPPLEQVEEGVPFLEQVKAEIVTERAADCREQELFQK